MFKNTILVFSLVLCGLISAAAIKPANIFTSHMVLQRNKPIHFWGTASPNEKVSVTLGSNTRNGRADKTGAWEIILPALPAGGPYTVTFKGSNLIVLDDILIGEVWLCSGQSNMNFPLQKLGGWRTGVINYEQAVAAANHPNIRFFTVEQNLNEFPFLSEEQEVFFFL